MLFTVRRHAPRAMQRVSLFNDNFSIMDLASSLLALGRTDEHVTARLVATARHLPGSRAPSEG